MQDIQANHPPRPEIPARKRLLRRAKSAFFRFEVFYRAYLGLKFGAARVSLGAEESGAPFPNKVLQNRAEWQAAARGARALGLPLHRAEEKSWDHVAAVRAIVSATTDSARVLDAGAEFYSNVLPALYVCGYRHLYGMNLAFADPARRGPIQFLPGDITRTGFPNGYFDAVTCMSVIEHGVPLEAYFREMFRILKPGGLLITSTDYYPEPIDTGGKLAHGAPVKIFSRTEMEAMLALAARCGFQSTGDLCLECEERPIRWAQYGLDYTFAIFTLRTPPLTPLQETGEPVAVAAYQS